MTTQPARLTYAQARESAQRDDARMNDAQRAELAAYLTAEGFTGYGGTPTLAQIQQAPDSFSLSQRRWIAAFRAKLG